MDLKYNNCPHCFANRVAGVSCPSCGFIYSKVDSQPDGALPVFTILNSRYLVGHVLGKGGFGITYSALDLQYGNLRCAIKEYYPSEFASRKMDSNTVFPVQTSKAANVFEHAKSKFLEEARLLYELRDSQNIVKLYNYFTENNTAYIVMEFLDGSDLRRYTKNSGGRIPFKMAMDVFDTCTTALMDVHNKGFLHRDISPDNIFVCNNPSGDRNGSSRYVLIDFGAARNFIGNNAHTILLKPGFAPPEAYSKTQEKGPSSDVYSLAATIYNVLSGQAIIDALFRARGTRQPSLYELRIQQVSKEFSDVIESAMSLDPKRRPQTMSEFRTRIMNCSASGSSVHSPFPTPGVDPPLTPTPTPTPKSPYDDPVPKKSVTATVTIVDGPKRGTSITLTDGQTIIIGRSRLSADLVVDYSDAISRRHCTLTFDAKKRLFYLMDDESNNGTFFYTNEWLVKGKRYEITSGQRFYLAQRQCMLMVKINDAEGYAGA